MTRISRGVWLVLVITISLVWRKSKALTSSTVEIFTNKLLDCTKLTLRDAITERSNSSSAICKVGRIFAADAYQCHIPHVAESVYAIYDSIHAHSGQVGRKKRDNYVMLSAHADVPGNHPVGWVEDLMKLITPTSMTLLNHHFPVQSGEFPLLCQTMLKNAGCTTPIIAFKSMTVSGIDKKAWFANKKAALLLRARLGINSDLKGGGEVCILKRKSRSLSNTEAIALAQNATVIEFTGSMTLSQQANLISRCRVVFSMHGAQLANVAWMMLSGAVIEFLPWGAQSLGYYFRELYDSLELTSIQIRPPREDSNLDKLSCFEKKFVSMTAEQCAKDVECFGCAKKADYVASVQTLEMINKDVSQLLSRMDKINT